MGGGVSHWAFRCAQILLCLFLSSLPPFHPTLNPWQKVGAELQERIQADFQALHSFLLEEEASLLEQLRREQEEWEQTLQRHLEAVNSALRDVEQKVGALQQAADARDHTVLVEVKIPQAYA